MASSTKAFRVKKKRKGRRKGHDRKAALESKGTTPTREAFFAVNK